MVEIHALRRRFHICGSCSGRSTQRRELRLVPDRIAQYHDLSAAALPKVEPFEGGIFGDSFVAHLLSFALGLWRAQRAEMDALLINVIFRPERELAG